MKQNFKYILLIIFTAVVMFFATRSCQECKPAAKVIQVDPRSLLDRVHLEEKEISALKLSAIIQRDTVIKWRDRWHTMKRDTIPCSDKVKLCDTVIVHDSIFMDLQSDIITRQDSVISGWHKIHAIDSCDIITAQDSAKYWRKKYVKQKWYKRGVIALWILKEGASLVK